MRLSTFGVERMVRRILPRGLFGRSLLIVLIPMVLLQAVALQIFYGNHLSELSRRLAGGVAGEVGLMVIEIDRAPNDAGGSSSLGTNISSSTPASCLGKGCASSRRRICPARWTRTSPARSPPSCTGPSMSTGTPCRTPL